MIITHKFVSPKSEQTDPTLVGPNEWNAQHVVIGDTTYSVPDYAFTPQVVGTPLTANVTNVITLSPVPAGVNGSDQNHCILLSDGANSESVVITGGTAIAGSQTGTLTFTPKFNHPATTTIQSATAGWQEAAQSAGQGGQIFFPAGVYPMYCTFTAPFNQQAYIGYNADEIIIQPVSSTNIQLLVNINNRSDLTFLGLGFDGNMANQNYVAGANNNCIAGSNATRTCIRECKFHAFGDVINAPTSDTTSSVILFYQSSTVLIRNNRFYSCFGAEIQCNASNDIVIDGNNFGVASLLQSQSNVNWWDTYSGGMGIFIFGCSQVSISNNVMYGVQRSSNVNVFGNMMYVNGAGGPQGYKHQIQQNRFYGLGNGCGTVSVTNGGTTINGTNVFFRAIDIGRKVVVEGDNTTYIVTAYSSPTSITVTPAIVRASASGLRYQYMNSGDAMGTCNVDTMTFSGNEVYDSGDNGYDVAASGPGYSYKILFSDNIASECINQGLFLGGGVANSVFANNIFFNNAKGRNVGYQSAILASPTNGGTETAKVIWHVMFTGNLFADGQPTPTQLYAFNLEIPAAASMYNWSLADNHFSIYNDSGNNCFFFNPGVTDTMLAGIFNNNARSNAQIFSPLTYATLNSIFLGSTPVNGAIAYCVDARSIGDGAAAGSVAATGGTGTLLQYINGQWRVV